MSQQRDVFHVYCPIPGADTSKGLNWQHYGEYEEAQDAIAEAYANGGDVYARYHDEPERWFSWVALTVIGDNKFPSGEPQKHPHRPGVKYD